MARHHVISTTACDVFFKLVAHQKKSLGARFDSMIVTFSADGHPDECWCCGDQEQLEFISPANVPLAHADYRLTLAMERPGRGRWMPGGAWRGNGKQAFRPVWR